MNFLISIFVRFLQRRRMSCRRVFVFAIFCLLLVQSKSSEKFVLPEPEACPRNAVVCGGDPQKYPAKEIASLIELASETNADETLDRFFGLNPPFRTGFVNFANESIRSTCDFRNEKLPRYPRMKNVGGDFVYVGQRSDQVQNIKIVYCVSPDTPCKIDSDSPLGEGTTICKQLFRTYKMLAVNTTGELVVDTFKFPSACVCHYKEPSWGVRSGFSFLFGADKSDQKTGPTCSASISSHKLEDNEERNSQLQLGRPSKLGRSELKIIPCEKGKIICDIEDWEYPVEMINALVNTHIAFKSPVFFEKLFGDVCDPDAKDEVSTRTLLFESNVVNLCSTTSKYFYPRKVKGQGGRWFFIVNTDRYRQGVTSDECLQTVLGKPCKYGGADGIDPEVKSKCLQVFSLQYFLVVNASGKLTYEVFNVPSTCSCYTQH